MKKSEAIEIASKFLEQELGSIPPLIGAKPFDRTEWTVLFETILPGHQPGDVVDGPTVVTIDVRTRSASFLQSVHCGR